MQRTDELNKAVNDAIQKYENVKKLSNTIGGDYINISEAPDVVIGLAHAKTKSYSLTVGAAYNCPKNRILNATWGIPKGDTLTYSGTWKVPKTHNGKSVKYGYLHMRPEYNVRQYTVQSRNYGTNKCVLY